MDKVTECYNNATMYLCERCKRETDSNGWYCDNCHPMQEVKFTVIEDMKDWNGEFVCPYCYNQLLEKRVLKNDN